MRCQVLRLVLTQKGLVLSDFVLSLCFISTTSCMKDPRMLKRDKKWPNSAKQHSAQKEVFKIQMQCLWHGTRKNISQRTMSISSGQLIFEKREFEIRTVPLCHLLLYTRGSTVKNRAHRQKIAQFYTCDHLLDPLRHGCAWGALSMWWKKCRQTCPQWKRN